ncbi:response regulator [Aquabacter sp. CN5-332]|uniref:response regulator n=1 Tax=Aquabacter sp. CN5-332 TaxID=3156608 RepID=UPI0032B33C22
MSDPLVLVVDDEAAIHRFLAPALSAAGYRVARADDGTSGLREIATHPPEVVLLDLGLPDMDGKEVIRRLREWSRIPVIVLSARDREAEKIEALDLGADDFVNKPFSVGELMARIRVALRTASGGTHEEPVLHVGSVEIDRARHRVTRDGVEVKLTPKEFDLLSFLARHAGRVLTHRQILQAVWGPAHVHDTQYLRVYVGQLRQRLESDPAAPSLILTEPGIGYRIGE